MLAQASFENVFGKQPVFQIKVVRLLDFLLVPFVLCTPTGRCYRQFSEVTTEGCSALLLVIFDGYCLTAFPAGTVANSQL